MNRTVDTQGNVLIEDILCPELSSVEFSSGLQNAFTTINDNFARLANHGFIKGDTGTSVYIDQISIYDENNVISNEICKKLAAYLSKLLGNQSRYIDADGIQLDYLDNFTPETAGKLQVIYNKIGDSVNTENVPVSSLQYVFLDGRFWNDKIGDIDSKYLDGITDLSSIIVYDSTEEGGFKSLNDAFPTMYYEPEIGLCWKLNGKPTGMPVQGIPGKDGKNSLMRIVKVANLTTGENITNHVGEVTYVFEDLSGYIPIDNEDININDYADSSALIINDSNGELHFGYLTLDKKEIVDEKTNETSEIDVLVAICDPAISLNNIIMSSGIHEAMKHINLVQSVNSPSALRGLFIPINHPDNGAQNAHLMSASSIINTVDLSSTKNDIIFTPVNDIDNINPTDENPLLVDKYLYIKVNPEYNKLLDSQTIHASKINSFRNLLGKYNYCIKYKLIHIAKSKDDNYLKPVDDITSPGYNFGFVKDSNDKWFKLQEKDVQYVGSDLKPVNSYKDTFPDDIDKCPLYVWEACIDKADYDIDDLINIPNIADYSDVPSNFRYICTRTFTPGLSTDIYWFNVFDVLNIIDDIFYVKGWSNPDKELFKFIKFVPVYKDEKYHVWDDTAINFNYNVNITGCDHEGSDATRNLTVHGDINCDNINVYRLTATGEIDNIYTKNEIVGDSGIRLSKDIDTKKHAFIVDSIGNVDAKSVTTEYIYATDVTSNNVISDNITAEKLTVEKDGNKYVDIFESNDKTDELEIDINNVNAFNINGFEKSFANKTYNNAEDIYKDINKVSKQNISNLPSIYTNNGNIIITDQSVSSPELYYYGAPKTYPTVLPDNSSKTIDFDTEKLNFDNAKKFNFNRIKNSTNSLSVTKVELNSEKLGFGVTSHSSREYKINYSSWQEDKTETFVTDEYLKFSPTYTLEEFIIPASENLYDSNIRISFKRKYVFHINLIGELDRGSWPTLNSSSNMKLELYYKDKNRKLTPTGLQQIYYFDKTGTEWSNNSKVYDRSDNLVTTYDNSDRIKSFFFKPDDFVINADSDLFKEIKLINNTSPVEFVVIPTFSIRSQSSAGTFGVRYNVVKGIGIHFPSATKEDIGVTTKLISSNSYVPIKTITHQDSTAVISYSKTADAEDINCTTICKDGVIFRVKDCMFGLGYSNDMFVAHKSISPYAASDNMWDIAGNEGKQEPVLFYYNSIDSHDMAVDEQKIARKLNTIPLKDIFTAIQVLKTNMPDKWSEAEKNNIFI
jgi:hypothetical protein